MASDHTLRLLAQDCIDGLEALIPRIILEGKDKQGANRQANRLGTAVSGGRGDGPQYADPTADEAGKILANQERSAVTLGEIKHTIYRMLNHDYAEYGPDMRPDGGIRRCGENDCARKHYAMNRCERHYRQHKKAAAARAAADVVRKAKRDDDGEEVAS